MVQLTYTKIAQGIDKRFRLYNGSRYSLLTIYDGEKLTEIKN